MSICTKWPRLVVVGEPVTEAQADEILIRTAHWPLFTNDKAYGAAIGAVTVAYGLSAEPDYIPGESADARSAKWRTYTAGRDAFVERMRVLDLEYLTNSQIASAWIGGPHGWCHWSGRIGCSSHNIGKWPNDDEVTDEWRLIAEAFPYLDLTAQCIDEEGEGRLAAEWHVKGGAVTYNPEPTTHFVDYLDEPSFGLLDPGRERGVTIDRLRQALARVAGTLEEMS